MAESHASLCRLEMYSNTPQDYGSVGQVLSVAGFQTVNVTRVIDVSWLAAETRYNYSTNTCNKAQACTNYKQVSNISQSSSMLNASWIRLAKIVCTLTTDQSNNSLKFSD